MGKRKKEFVTVCGCENSASKLHLVAWKRNGNCFVCPMERDVINSNYEIKRKVHEIDVFGDDNRG